MNIGDLLGAMVQTGMSPSSTERMKKSLGGGNELDGLAGRLGDASGKAGGEIGDLLSSVLGGGKGGAPSSGGGIGDLLSSVLGGGQKSGAAGTGGGIGDLLSNVLGDAGKAVGGNKNLAIGGLGALVGSILGGGGKSAGGAIGGGLMALLGALAFNALKGAGQSKPQIPAGLLEPETEDEQKMLNQSSELVLRAMINATKADGRVDQNEINRIMGKFDEIGVDAEGKKYLMDELQKPMETERLIAEAQGQPELAAQMYAASLLAIEVDTEKEKEYLNQLATGLGLNPPVVASIHNSVGLPSA
ncbi:MAG: tellurite resistance TerB family protein [Smithella sp.]|nr:tellurite resistance TerB family protein [Smithella sp.]HOU50304.1 tellurite resistance TerB family protein [Smithella sp.]HQG64242.1 tellurite resistance TerB family protein [Smithella sp.]HQH16984.1 tellurite resistance TerB family protein [Smithella sp.]HQI72122.1 tellurite resistance TerB family protein [Smithella sp.]